jgi:hypothetical protein
MQFFPNYQITLTCHLAEDFETTEGESEDLYDKYMEIAGWMVRRDSLLTQKKT